MKNNNLIFKVITFVHLIINSIIYILLFGFRILDNTLYIFVYSAIIISLIYSFVSLLFQKTKSSFMLFVAFVFTSIADTFLILLDDYYILALVFFIFTQISYFIYIRITFSNKKWLKDIFLRLLTIVIGTVLIPFVEKDSRLITFLSIVYFSNLLLNFIYSCCVKKKNYLFIIGLLLFICCDFCVGCFNIGDIIEISNDSLFAKIRDYPINLSWLFYYPSQILLSVSNFDFHKEKS